MKIHEVSMASALAFFWPANSVLLGLLIRFPITRRPSAFLGAYIGFAIMKLNRRKNLKKERNENSRSEYGISCP
jgi:hypothetical protein